MRCFRREWQNFAIRAAAGASGAHVGMRPGALRLNDRYSAGRKFGFILRGPKNGSGSQSQEFPPRSSNIIHQIRSDSPRSIT